jgi:hypothetical protein
MIELKNIPESSGIRSFPMRHIRAHPKAGARADV